MKIIDQKPSLQYLAINIDTKYYFILYTGI